MPEALSDCQSVCVEQPQGLDDHSGPCNKTKRLTVSPPSASLRVLKGDLGINQAVRSVLTRTRSFKKQKQCAHDGGTGAAAGDAAAELASGQQSCCCVAAEKAADAALLSARMSLVEPVPPPSSLLSLMSRRPPGPLKRYVAIWDYDGTYHDEMSINRVS